MLASVDESGNEIVCGYYVVAFVVLLGQSNELGKWKELPRSAEDKAAFTLALKRTVGAVHRVRADFEQFLEATRLGNSIPPRFSGKLSKEQEAEYLRLIQYQLEYQHFSDTTVVFSRLADSDRNVTLNGVQDTVGARQRGNRTGVPLHCEQCGGVERVSVRMGTQVGGLTAVSRVAGSRIRPPPLERVTHPPNPRVDATPHQRRLSHAVLISRAPCGILLNHGNRNVGRRAAMRVLTAHSLRHDYVRAGFRNFTA